MNTTRVRSFPFSTFSLALLLAFSLEPSAFSALPSGPPLSPLYSTNRTAAALISALKVSTNGQSLSFDGGSVTNLQATNIVMNGANAAYAVATTIWTPPGGPAEVYGGPTVYMPLVGGMYEIMTQAGFLTNLTCNLYVPGGQPVSLLIITNNATLQGSNFWSLPYVVSNYYGLSVFPESSNLLSLNIPATPVAVGTYVHVLAMAWSGSEYVGIQRWSTNNAGGTRHGYESSTTTNGNINVSGSYFGPSFFAYGYTNVSVTATNLITALAALSAPPAAASVTYSTNTSGLPLTNLTAQGALDGLSYLWATSSIPFLASNTIVVADGDSKMRGVVNYLNAYPGWSWWKSLPLLTNVAVNGSTLSDATNRWATNTASLSSLLKNGTNGLYLLWTMHNDVDLNTPATEIGMLSNHLAQVASSNWNIMVLTVAPIVGTSHDTPAARLFVPAVNNWIRNSLFPWRVVDAEQILPNPYDTNLVSDAVHPQPAGYTNIIYAINKELFAPAKTMWPQRWVNAYGTNIVVSVPGATNAAPVVAAQFSASGFFLPTNSSAWPAASPSPGGCCFVNSNGTVYLLNCPPGSTSWSATNLLGHP